MSGSNFANLKKAILNNSVEKTDFIKATLEWSIIDCVEDEEQETTCVCGKENLKYLFTIKNDLNNKTLFPIGSTCIKKFDRSDLNRIINIKISLFNLLHAVDNNEFLSLSPDLFSKGLLLYLYNEGAFDTDYNCSDGEEDYNFLLQMFNKRDKDSITIRQRKKISAILLNSIKPYIINLLENKLKTK